VAGVTVVAMLSYRGGTGKTTAALNLAQGLFERDAATQVWFIELERVSPTLSTALDVPALAWMTGSSGTPATRRDKRENIRDVLKKRSQRARKAPGREHRHGTPRNLPLIVPP
jgi:Mrp family chromosome partitioning ATPase